MEISENIRTSHYQVTLPPGPLVYLRMKTQGRENLPNFNHMTISSAEKASLYPKIPAYSEVFMKLSDYITSLAWKANGGKTKTVGRFKY